MTRYYEKTYPHSYGRHPNRVTEHIRMGSEYQFVPCAPKIEPAVLAKPGVGGLEVSHSRPLPGGFSGTLEVDLFATTPFLFGMKDSHDVTVPAKVPFGGTDKYVIPGKAARAMIKSIYRIATASALAPVDVHDRFATRSFDYRKSRWFGGHNSPNPLRMQRGWLVPVETDAGKYSWWIKPEIVKTTTRDIGFNLLNRVSNRWNSNRFHFDDRRKAVKDYEGDVISNFLQPDTYLIVTGWMNGKNQEAVFNAPNPQQDSWINVPEMFMNHVLQANSKYNSDGAIFADGAKRTVIGNFAEFAKDHIQYLLNIGCADEAKKLKTSLGLSDVSSYMSMEGCPGIPVYYYQPNSDDVFFGTAQVFKTPVLQDVKTVHARRPLEHEKTGHADWVDTAFGSLDPWSQGKNAQPLASRTCFGFSQIESGTEPVSLGNMYVSQGAPQASFDMHYLYEPDPRSPAQPVDGTWDSSTAVLSGHKRYPASRPYTPEFWEARDPGSSQQNTVAPLQSGATFRLKIKFHNLHPLELGALLWAVSFGDRRVFAEGEDKTPYRHVGGRLRNKGLGRFRPENAALVDLVQNPMPEGLRLQDIEDEHHRIDALLLAFETHMGARFKAQYAMNDKTDIEAFYAALPITTLLNVSDSTWTGEDEAPDVMDKIFAMPTHDHTGQPATGGAYFKPFMGLRKALYLKQGVYGGAEPLNTLLDAFFKPEHTPPENREAPCETVFNALLDPVKALESWRAERAG